MSAHTNHGAITIIAAMSLCMACQGGQSATTDAATDPGTDSGTDSGTGTGTSTDEPTTSTASSQPGTSGTTTEAPTTGEPDPTGDLTTTTGDTDTGGDPLGLVVHLVPQPGVSGLQRINFAVPLAPGQLSDPTQIRVLHDNSELDAASRGIAAHPDGSLRSVQVQVELELVGETDLEVMIGAAPTAGSIDLIAVADTLVDDLTGPRVWALLPAEWLSASGFAGPLDTEAAAENTPGAAWASLCDYAKWGHDAFVQNIDDAAVWLYDRGTTHYRGHARRGDLDTLRSAYLETTHYRNGLTGAGPDTTIGVPGKASDAKYYYSQNMALHYLLSGDDRFRDSAEDVALAYAGLWSDPGYSGGADFWTERHAGFALLAYVWALNVTDDKADQFRDLADAAVTAYLDVQATYPLGYTDPDARCFAHSADAAGEDYDYFGCSPWLSAILADGLDQYATERPGPPADAARAAIVKLGRSIARDGLDPNGKPYYWMGVGDGQGAVDSYDEHWGESAYVIAMAHHHDGAADPELKAAAEALVTGLADNGVAPHMRSFNWQCRSAVAAPWFLTH